VYLYEIEIIIMIFKYFNLMQLISFRQPSNISAESVLVSAVNHSTKHNRVVCVSLSHVNLCKQD
jgi:hypothetical protein